jgi:hypothetical protein
MRRRTEAVLVGVTILVVSSLRVLMPFCAVVV